MIVAFLKLGEGRAIIYIKFEKLFQVVIANEKEKEK